MPKGLADLATGGAPETFGKGEWLKSVPGKAERRAILGVRKAALLEAGLPVEKLYARPRGPLSRIKTVDETARAIKAMPKAKLVALARRMGKSIVRGATRAQIVNLLVDKEIF